MTTRTSSSLETFASVKSLPLKGSVEDEEGRPLLMTLMMAVPISGTLASLSCRVPRRKVVTQSGMR